ncbi:hypothetical protein K501DRAFT_271843 [Backusella circina FSU 941]|nr:hypothetical protein K501DRAFT_271843 [Backusella circina FSU 941]
MEISSPTLKYVKSVVRPRTGKNVEMYESGIRFQFIKINLDDLHYKHGPLKCHTAHRLIYKIFKGHVLQGHDNSLENLGTVDKATILRQNMGDGEWYFPTVPALPFLFNQHKSCWRNIGVVDEKDLSNYEICINSLVQITKFKRIKSYTFQFYKYDYEVQMTPRNAIQLLLSKSID